MFACHLGRTLADRSLEPRGRLWIQAVCIYHDHLLYHAILIVLNAVNGTSETCLRAMYSCLRKARRHNGKTYVRTRPTSDGACCASSLTGQAGPECEIYMVRNLFVLVGHSIAFRVVVTHATPPKTVQVYPLSIASSEQVKIYLEVLTASPRTMPDPHVHFKAGKPTDVYSSAITCRESIG